MGNLKSFVLILMLSLASCIICGQVYDWRGPDRNGIIPETGLLKSWTDKGPEMIWSYQGLGEGHTSIGPGKDRFFITGLENKTGILFAFDYNGKLIWKKPYGPEWTESYPGPRSTPVVISDLVYFQSGHGIVYCYNVTSGEKVWSVDLKKKFEGRQITWGMTECLLIKGEILYCTPGGIKSNIAALNRFTGETVWTSPGNKQPSAYCSSLFIKHNNTGLIVTMTEESIIGVDAKTGEFYWQVPQYQWNKIHANTPFYSGGVLYCSSENDEKDCGIVALKLSPDGKSVKVLWRNREYQNLMGGIIMKDGYIFGSTYNKNTWCCIDPSNGKIIHSFTGFGDGSILLAEGLFYCYGVRGEMALMSADKTAYRLISKFRIPMGEGPHFSHPVIYSGRLYVRHGSVLMVYEIKA